MGAQQADYFQSATGKVLTIDIFSPPYKWTVADTVGSFNAAIMNRSTGNIASGNIGDLRRYTDYPCPYLVPDSWEYLFSGQWLVDDTLSVRCVDNK